MFKQYLEYVFTRPKVRGIIIIRSILLILIVFSVGQGGGVGTLALLFSVLGIIGTYFAIGYVLRADMDPANPISLGKYFRFFLWMVVFAFGILFLLNFVVAPFITPEMEASLKAYMADPTKPLPEDLARFYLIAPFIIGLIYSLVLPVLFAKVNVWEGIRSLPKYIQKSEYITTAWTPYVIMFVPTLILSLISGAPDMVASFWGQILILLILFFSLTSDVILQFPTFFIVRRGIQERNDSAKVE